MASNSAELDTMLAQMLRGFQTPPRSLTLFNEWDRYRKQYSADNPKIVLMTGMPIHAFVTPIIDQFIENLNLPLLRDLCSSTLSKIADNSQFDVATLALQAEEPDRADVQRTLQTIYTQLAACQEQREAIQHYLIVLKHAENYIKIFRNALEQLILTAADVVIEPHLSVRVRLFATITLDIDAYATILGQLRNDLVGALEQIVSPRNQIIIRAESSLRLLTKYVEQDNANNHAFSHPNTRQPQENSTPFNTQDFHIDG